MTNLGQPGAQPPVPCRVPDEVHHLGELRHGRVCTGHVRKPHPLARELVVFAHAVLRVLRVPYQLPHEGEVHEGHRRKEDVARVPQEVGRWGGELHLLGLQQLDQVFGVHIGRHPGFIEGRSGCFLGKYLKSVGSHQNPGNQTVFHVVKERREGDFLRLHLLGLGPHQFGNSVQAVDSNTSPENPINEPPPPSFFPVTILHGSTIVI
mmetsp:Transcript_14800/g.24194  ORF Transcript_14800/g.24194 Transcript_14800/m.24194 type:complete len:207 (+) Transcript_14800:13-633(+)